MVLILFITVLSDPDKIRTCNLLIRSEMRYPVAPQGHYISRKRAANIFLFTFTAKLRTPYSMDFKKYIRDVKDFPSEGIVFKDITPLLKDPKTMNLAVEALLQLLENSKIDKVIGMESRGFFFAPLLASKLNAGFVPVRKAGKLPSEKISEIYSLEYGIDTLEIHKDAIKKGERVLIHDDVLATGGTAKAVCKLVERLEGEIVQCNFLIELDFLKGKEKLRNYEVKSLINY